MNKDFVDGGMNVEIANALVASNIFKPNQFQFDMIVSAFAGQSLAIQNTCDSDDFKKILAAITLNKCINNPAHQKALILVPSFTDVRKVLEIFSIFCTYVPVPAYYGCMRNSSLCQDALQFEKSRILIFTPSRFLWLLYKHALDTKNLTFLVIMEIDEMSARGTLDHVRCIAKYINLPIQVILVSSKPAKSLEKHFPLMKDPVFLTNKTQKLSLTNVKQYRLVLDSEEHKFRALCDLCDNLQVNQMIVYCNTRNKAIDLSRMLNEDGLSASSIHSNLSEDDRQLIISEFLANNIRIIVATDILTKHDEVTNFHFSINFDFPLKKEMYLNRVGSDDESKSKVVVNFIIIEKLRSLCEVEEYYKTTIADIPPILEEIWTL